LQSAQFSAEFTVSFTARQICHKNILELHEKKFIPSRNYHSRAASDILAIKDDKYTSAHPSHPENYTLYCQETAVKAKRGQFNW